jgi:GAF domain-containing protein
MVSDSHLDFESRRYETLLQMADILVRHRNLGDFFHDVTERLHTVISFDLIFFAFHDPAIDHRRVQFWQGADISANQNLHVDETPSGWVWNNQQPLAIPDIAREERFVPAMKNLQTAGIRSYSVLPLTTPQRKLARWDLVAPRSTAITTPILSSCNGLGK